MRFIEEFSAASLSLRFLPKNTLHFIPLVNPDGVDSVLEGKLPIDWKANINGVDLNSNYPAGWEKAKIIKEKLGYNKPGPKGYPGTFPLSEPESRALVDYTLFHDFKFTLSFHTQGEEIYWRYSNCLPEGSEEMANQFSRASGYTCEDAPDESSHAGYKDWFIESFNKPGFTIECGLGENPLPIWQFDKIYAQCIGILLLAGFL